MVTSQAVVNEERRAVARARTAAGFTLDEALAKMHEAVSGMHKRADASGGLEARRPQVQRRALGLIS